MLLHESLSLLPSHPHFCWKYWSNRLIGAFADAKGLLLNKSDSRVDKNLKLCQNFAKIDIPYSGKFSRSENFRGFRGSLTSLENFTLEN